MTEDTAQPVDGEVLTAEGAQSSVGGRFIQTRDQSGKWAETEAPLTASVHSDLPEHAGLAESAVLVEPVGHNTGPQARLGLDTGSK